MTYDLLKALISECGVHEQLGPKGQGWWIEQNPHELATFLNNLVGVKKVLEIGTAQGGLYRFFRDKMGWDVYVIDISPPKPVHTKEKYYQGNSHSEEAVEWAKSRGPFDLVFIDADHKYESVDKDYHLYTPLASSYVAFHDICGDRDCHGSKKHWDELKQKDLVCNEAVAVGKQRSGIGWIVL